MIRTLIVPQQQNISIQVPKEYVGKQVEVFLYAVDELVKQDEFYASADLPKPGNSAATKNKKASDFKGVLSSQLTEELQQHIQQSREQWQ